MSDNTIRKELAALQKMTPKQLRQRYRELYGNEARSGNRLWLMRRCAWRVQALAEGDMTERAERVRERALAIPSVPPLKLPRSGFVQQSGCFRDQQCFRTRGHKTKPRR